MVMRWVGGWAALAALVVLVGGCSGKDPGDALEGIAERGIDESRLGADSRGSLADAQGGSLGLPGSEGPLEDIRFGYNSVDLGQQARNTLQRNAAWLAERPDTKVEIEGHCDDRGTIEYNLALGARRASAAKNYLIALGVAPSRITTISYGEELPLCRDAVESCWGRNRRGHFVVFGQ